MSGKEVLVRVKIPPDKRTCEMLDYVQNTACAEERGSIEYSEAEDTFKFSVKVNGMDRAFFPQLEHVEEIIIVTTKGQAATNEVKQPSDSR